MNLLRLLQCPYLHYIICVRVQAIYLEPRWWWISFGEKRIGILLLFFFLVRFDYLSRNL